jgi:hypothetical protein
VHVEHCPLQRPNSPRVSRLRPDLLIEGPDVNVLADVAVTTLTAATYLNAGSARIALKAAHINAQRKAQKYGELARFERRYLYPVAVESFGGMYEKARALINLIADRAAEFGCGWQHQRAETFAHINAMSPLRLCDATPFSPKLPSAMPDYLTDRSSSDCTVESS